MSAPCEAPACRTVTSLYFANGVDAVWLCLPHALALANLVDGADPSGTRWPTWYSAARYFVLPRPTAPQLAGRVVGRGARVGRSTARRENIAPERRAERARECEAWMRLRDPAREQQRDAYHARWAP